MTRDVDPQLDPGPDDDREPREPEGRLRPTSYGLLAAWAIGGLVLGWLWKRVAEEVNGNAPVVSWAQPAALLTRRSLIGLQPNAYHY